LTTLDPNNNNNNNKNNNNNTLTTTAPLDGPTPFLLSGAEQRGELHSERIATHANPDAVARVVLARNAVARARAQKTLRVDRVLLLSEIEGLEFDGMLFSSSSFILYQLHHPLFFLFSNHIV
jgi:hypothetical protein